MQHLDVSGIIVRVGIVVGTNAQRGKIEVGVRGQETVDGWMKNVRFRVAKPLIVMRLNALPIRDVPGTRMLRRMEIV